MHRVVALLISAVGCSALRVAPARMQVQTATEATGKIAATGGKVGPSGGWETVVSNAQGMCVRVRVRVCVCPDASPTLSLTSRMSHPSIPGRAAAVKADQDAVTAVAVTGTLGCLALPGTLLLPFDNLFLDLILSAIGGGLLGGVAGFREDALGDTARSAGKAVASVTGQVVEKIPFDQIKEKLGLENGLSYDDVKKYGVAGTLAYIITELAFWAVAFPVASTSFYNLNGHWPDFGDGGDRTAVLAFIFAGANVARLVVPVRFGVAFALAPWVDENICQRFGIGGGDDKKESDSSE
jgi:hypothetical protein